MEASLTLLLSPHLVSSHIQAHTSQADVNTHLHATYTYVP